MIPPVDISPQHFKKILDILEKHVPRCEVRAFGSRVAMTATPSSDLDIVIMTAEPVAPGAMAALKDDFTESDLPFRVDVVDWARTKDGFRAIIDGTAVTIKNGK